MTKQIEEAAVGYVMRYGGMCRDCADMDGVCQSGMPCDTDQRRAVIRHTIAALTYGINNGFIASPFATAITKATATTPAPDLQAENERIPDDVVESLLAIGPVEWGVTFTQSDEKHASDLLDTMRITREHFGLPDGETEIHGVYLEGTGTVLAHTGMSPNSPQHARILVGAWNQLVQIAKAKAKAALERT